MDLKYCGPWSPELLVSSKSTLIWNEMKLNIFFLIKFTAILGNAWKQNTEKLINYLIFMIKKIKRKQNFEEMP